MTPSHATIYTSNTDDVDVNRDALGLMRYFAMDAAESLVLQFSLSSLLFGALTILSLSSIFLLFRQRSLANALIGIPLLSIIVLYASMTVYMASLIWNWRTTYQIIQEADEGIFSETYNRDASILGLQKQVLKQSWMATVGLGVNVILGDAVVWWRVCVIWRHRAIYFAGATLLLVTLVLGIVGVLESNTGPVLVLNIFAGGNGISDVALVLSLVTNLVATSLIAVKAFLHHRRLKKYLCASGTKTRVLKVFALLIESGIIYCLILLVVLIYQFSLDSYSPLVEAEFYFVFGCFMPLVAIYPTSIIFLTALNWSPLDWGLSPLKEPGHQ